MTPDEQPNADEIDSYIPAMERWLVWRAVGWALFAASVAGLAWWVAR